MTSFIAEQIAALLNLRNQLSKEYTAADILAAKEQFIIIEEGAKVSAVAQVKLVQWYQAEICHVAVQKECEGKGLGQKILGLAETNARLLKARIVQCTIRVGNDRSEALFIRNGYRKTSEFYNQRTRNIVNVYQKVIAVPEY